MTKQEKLIHRIYNLCYLLTGDTGLAQDLCIKTFINKEIEYQKDEEAFILLAKKAVKLLMERKCTGFSGNVSSDDHTSELQKALNNLPPKERIVIVLHDTYALSYFQIEPLFPEEDVRILSKDGRKKLANVLKNDLLERSKMLAR